MYEFWAHIYTYNGLEFGVKADSYNRLIDKVIESNIPLIEVKKLYSEMCYAESGLRVRVIEEAKLRAAVSARLAASR